MLKVLTEKKAKSIAGEIPDDKNAFDIANDATGEENRDRVNIKLIRYLSHPSFTYFRGDDDNLTKITLKDEELKALREIAERRKQEKEKGNNDTGNLSSV